MSTQLTKTANRRSTNKGRKIGFPLWKAFAAAGVTGVTVAMMPTLMPGFVESLSGATPQAYWYVSRASAFVAFGLLWLSMMAGLGITSKLSRIWPGMLGSYELHRFTGLLGIGFGLVHALALLGDKYVGYTLGQLATPFFSGSYHAEWVGFGQLSFYLMVIVSFSFYVRNRIGVHAWRMIHMLSFTLFLMVLIHGLKSGSDSAAPWALAMYWGSAASVLFGSVYRVLAVRKGRAREARTSSGLVIAGGRAQARSGQLALATVSRPVPQVVVRGWQDGSRSAG
jgi:predicted ferric reductase